MIFSDSRGVSIDGSKESVRAFEVMALADVCVVLILTGDVRPRFIASSFLMHHLQPAWRNWLETCRRSGVTTSLDTNWDPVERWEGVVELFPLIDVLLPNEAEALATSKQTDVLSAARTLVQDGSVVVVKRGENGALAVKDDRFWELHASESQILPHYIVDTTGAGDDFDAGFLRARLRKESIYDCLALAHKCAASRLEYAGGVAGQLRESDITSNLPSLEICE